MEEMSFGKKCEKEEDEEISFGKNGKRKKR